MIEVWKEPASRLPNGTEHEEQTALFQRAAWSLGKYPELRWLFAVPNGGHRSKAVAGKLKAEGVKKGVPDIWLPVPRGTFHGLIIEMKVAVNRPSGQQREWLAYLDSAGYRVAVCYGELAAWAFLEDYLNGGTAFGQAERLRSAPV